MAIHLTMFSPMCCCHNVNDVLPVSDAWRPYCDLEDELVATIVSGESVQNSRELLSIELDCVQMSVPAVLV